MIRYKMHLGQEGAGGLAGWRAGGLAGWRAGGLVGWWAGGLVGWRATGGGGGGGGGRGKAFLGFRDCKIMSFPDVQAA
jgi:hypothetical protein